MNEEKKIRSGIADNLPTNFAPERGQSSVFCRLAGFLLASSYFSSSSVSFSFANGEISSSSALSTIAAAVVEGAAAAGVAVDSASEASPPLQTVDLFYQDGCM